MIHIALIRLLVIILVGYIIYLIYSYFVVRIGKSSSSRRTIKRESAEYDEEEWEKIKRELEQK